MKKLTLFSALLLLVFNTGCEQSTEPTSYVYISFDVESNFQNDSVRLALDNQLLLNSPVTTNYSVSLAWSSGLKRLSKTFHRLHFSVVDYGIQKDYQVDVTNDTSTVLIHFYKSTKQIDFMQVKGIVRRR